MQLNINANLGMLMLFSCRCLALEQDRQGHTDDYNPILLGTAVAISEPSRTVWVKERGRDWWYITVLTKFTDANWRDNFCMTRMSFEKLCEMVKPFMCPKDINLYVRDPIPFNLSRHFSKKTVSSYLQQ